MPIYDSNVKWKKKKKKKKKKKTSTEKYNLKLDEETLEKKSSFFLYFSNRIHLGICILTIKNVKMNKTRSYKKKKKKKRNENKTKEECVFVYLAIVYIHWPSYEVLI